MVVSVLVALAVLVLVVYYGPELIEALQRVHFGWTLAGLGCYGVNYHLRATRFRIISKGRIRIWPEGLHASCIHGFASYMMPFRSGELALPIILHNLTDLSLTEGGRILVRARLLDLMTLGFWILGAVILEEVTLPTAIRIVWLLVGIVMLIAPSITYWLAIKGRLSPYPFFKKMVGLFDPERFRPLELLVSLGIWAAVAGVFFCVAQAIGLPIRFVQVWLLITLQLPLQLVPIQGIANAGNHEAGWVAGLVLVGFSTSQAMAFALTSHAILLLYVIALGPVALFTGRFCGRVQIP